MVSFFLSCRRTRRLRWIGENHVGQPAQGGGRGYVDDIAPAEPLHDRKDRPGDEERAPRVDPITRSHCATVISSIPRLVDARAIDGDVDAVPGLERAVDGRLHGAFIADIATDTDRRRA